MLDFRFARYAVTVQHNAAVFKMQSLLLEIYVEVALNSCFLLPFEHTGVFLNNDPKLTMSH